MTSKKRFRLVQILFLLVVSVIVGPKIVQADETAGIGYQVEPIFSKEQIDPDKGFYYLKTIPGAEQTIEAEIVSTQKEPVDIRVSVLDAYTQDNGLMGYTNKEKLDESLKNPISTLVKAETEVVTIQNFEKKKVKFKIKMPEESYEGVKAGALLFSKEDKSSKGISSKNEFRIGVLLSENGDSYSDSHTLNLLNAKATIKDAKKVVSLTFQNPEPKILPGLEMEVTLIDKKTGKVVKTKKVTDYTMAPNSNFEFDLDWGIEKIPTGVFIAKVEAANGQENWSLTKEFEISAKKSKDLNSNSPYQIITPMWVKIVSVILGTASICIFILILIRKNKREIRLKKMKRGKSRKRKG